MFNSIDSDDSGSLSLPEVVLFLKSITDDISEENIEKIFESLDSSGDRVVDFEEFKVLIISKMITKNSSLLVIAVRGLREGLEQGEESGEDQGGGGEGPVQLH